MDGILPPSAISNAQPQLQQQQSGFEAQITVSQIQAKIPLGTTLMAQVMGNDKNGNIIVRANGSDLLLSSPLALTKGAQLQIRLDTVNGNIVAQLLSVDGKLPVYRPQDVQNQPQSQQRGNEISVPMKLINVFPEGTTKPVNPQQAQVQAQPQQPQPQAQTIQRVDSVTLSSPTNNVMRAIVIQPSPEMMQGVRAALSLSTSSEEKLIKTLPSEIRAGTEANVKITGVISQPRSDTAPAAQNNAPKVTPQDEPIDTANTVLKGQDWMKKTAELGVKNNLNWLESFIPTMKGTRTGTLQMNALVMEAKPDGELTVETKLGLMLINGTINSKTPQLQRGMEIVMEIIKLSEPSKTVRKENTLHENEQATIKAVLNNYKAEAQKLAGTESNFAAKLVSFLQAVQSGDVEKWVGAEFLDSLDDTTRAGLINKLGGDFASLRNLMAEGPQTTWQTLLFPVYDGKELNQARLHVKKFKEESANQVIQGTRFIVELDTSRYGEMQFDGLVRKMMPQKSFDLIIRSHEGLDAETKQGITEIFHSTQEVSRFKGGIEFSTNPQFPMEPWKELVNKTTSHDSVIS